MIAQPRLALASLAACAVALWVAALISRAPLADLARARAELARHEAIVAHPPAAPPRALPLRDMIAARTSAAASDALAALLRKRALDAGLLVEALDPRPGTALAEVGLTLSGSEPALLRFVAAVEGQAPLIRFRSWRFEAAPAARAVRLDGVAIALWSEEA